MKLRLLLLLSLCSMASMTFATERQYVCDHDRLVDAVVQAIAQEAHVKPFDVKVTELEDKGMRITKLESCYIQYSRIIVKIKSGAKYCGNPSLDVVIRTDEWEIFHTRHREWEQRIHELALLKMRARTHREESRPTALPFAAPAVKAPEAPANKEPLPKILEPLPTPKP